MKFTIRVFTIIPNEAGQAYSYTVEADSLDQAGIQLSRKIAHDWVEIPDDRRIINIRASYIAATEIEAEPEPDLPKSPVLPEAFAV
jgi:hypothetical protein